MSKKKRKRKEDTEGGSGVTPATNGSAKAGGTARPSSAAERSQSQKTLAAFGFGLCGLMLGGLTGVNQFPAVPATLIYPGAIAAFQGVSLGLQPLDWTAGAEGALLGVCMGGGLGYSIRMEPAQMLACWVLGFLGLSVGLPHGLPQGAVGWLVGFAAAAGVSLRGREAAPEA